jgi:excisionase family DNA binding protein
MEYRMVTVKEACRALGIGRTNFYKLLNLGQIQAVRFGGRTLVPIGELARAVANAPPLKTPGIRAKKASGWRAP